MPLFNAPPGLMSAWTPTLTGITIGSGTVYARYNKVGTMVFFEFRLVFAVDTSITGNVSFTLPVNSLKQHMFHGHILDSGNEYLQLAGLIINGDCLCYVQSHTGTYMGGYTNLSSTVPMTWAVNDEIVIRGTYEST